MSEIFYHLSIWKMQIEFKKLTFDPKKGIVLEFATPTIWHVDSEHILMLKRPVVDKEEIRRITQTRYADEISKWLFTDESRAEMEEKIKNLEEEEQERIDKMPSPAIFIWTVSEIKHKWSETNFKFFINTRTGVYFLETGVKLQSLLFLMDFKPAYTSPHAEKKALEEIVYKFTEGTRDALSFIKI